MKCKWIKVCQWLLGALGISASIASCGDPLGIMLVEYGQPNMDYSVKGKVVDSETGAGVPGIEVSHERWGRQTDTTDANGCFEICGNSFPAENFEVEITDIDPLKDGNYKSAQAVIKLSQVKKGNGHWYNGAFEANDAILEIEKQDAE